MLNNEYFMKEALKEAKKAFDKDEIPIGAVIVANNQIISRSHNLTEALNDVTAHAEMQAITSASNNIGGKYLNECEIYVTVEPCVMCAGALYWAQIKKIVFGAYDEKRGFTKFSKQLIHPKTELVEGVLQGECEQLMITFFEKLRRLNKLSETN